MYWKSVIFCISFFVLKEKMYKNIGKMLNLVFSLCGYENNI